MTTLILTARYRLLPRLPCSYNPDLRPGPSFAGAVVRGSASAGGWARSDDAHFRPDPRGKSAGGGARLRYYPTVEL